MICIIYMKEIAGETVMLFWRRGVCVKDLLFSFCVFVFFWNILIYNINSSFVKINKLIQHANQPHTMNRVLLEFFQSHVPQDPCKEHLPSHFPLNVAICYCSCR